MRDVFFVRESESIQPYSRIHTGAAIYHDCVHVFVRILCVSLIYPAVVKPIIVSVGGNQMVYDSA